MKKYHSKKEKLHEISKLSLLTGHQSLQRQQPYPCIPEVRPNRPAIVFEMLIIVSNLIEIAIVNEYPTYVASALTSAIERTNMAVMHIAAAIDFSASFSRNGF